MPNPLPTPAELFAQKRNAESKAKADKAAGGDGDDSDTLLEELERDIDDDFDLGGFRERRLAQLRAQAEAAQKMRESNYGRYTEMKDEKELITAMGKAPRSVVHFFHRDFRRCKIMDSHLHKLGSKYINTLFMSAEVTNVPFLVNKFGVEVLPCVIGFAGGVSKMKLVGFDDLPGGDDFTTETLERLLKSCEVIRGGASVTTDAQKSNRRGEEADDSDLDL